MTKQVLQQALKALDEAESLLGMVESKATTDPRYMTFQALQHLKVVRSALAQPDLTTCNCRWNGETQVQQCTLHEAHVDAIHEWAERAKTAEAALAQQVEQQPVEYFQVYRCGIKSRAKIRAEIPREKQGWWADVCPGETLSLRQAVQADIDRCSLNAAHSRNPDDYMCETFTSGALVAKYAIEFMNPEENVFACVAGAAPAAQPDARKVIEQMVGALDWITKYVEATPKALERAHAWASISNKAIQAGQQWLEENK